MHAHLCFFDRRAQASVNLTRGAREPLEVTAHDCSFHLARLSPYAYCIDTKLVWTPAELGHEGQGTLRGMDASSDDGDIGST